MNNTWTHKPQFNADSIAVAPKPTFEPWNVPEVAAGYWWSAALTSGFGTTSFKALEGNGKSSFDLVQATVANQPTILAENGRAQFRMRKQADSNPSRLATAAAVQAGWTGATYIAYWLRLPDASGDITGTVVSLSHFGGAGARRFVQTTASGSPDLIRLSTSSDGTATVTQPRFLNVYAGSAWIWCEWVFDPLLILGGTTDADRVKLFANLAQQTPNSTAAVGATLFDASAQLVAFAAAASVSNADTTDWATCFYANGIPDLGNRRLLANYLSPVEVTF